MKGAGVKAGLQKGFGLNVGAFFCEDGFGISMAFQTFPTGCAF